MAQSEQQQRANRRLAWVLASVALVFALGFVAKIAVLGP
ncbi:cytochrome oxidase small assembly protein [Ideonella sp.]|nr:cytochrome oxidase small assembly protein [Ideonella sp.]HJV67798.1 cytochrome oxidase small assembly protein [Ideonella sp.]